jgi:hypothetical protein
MGTIVRLSYCVFRKHGASMAVGEREIYNSANGDRWFLCREGDRLFVLHRANEPSGGKLTPMELGDFLRKVMLDRASGVANDRSPLDE